MKLRFALAGLVALSGAALSVGIASAMPLAPLEQSQASNEENVLWFAARVVVSVLPLSTVTATVSVDTDTACIVMDTAYVEDMVTTAAIAVTKFKEWA